jgi:3'(2'), 5'-bisphosphate nucleotidase
MNISDLKDVLDTTKKLAREAGRIILSIYSEDFSVDYKDDYTPVTEADRKSNDYIISVLKNKYPECAILAEESPDDPNSRVKNDWCFIIDPLDGTKEFVKKNGEFTVNIALAYKGKAVLGVIGIPVTDELYYAAEGMGAFYENKEQARKIKVSDKTKDICLLKSRSHQSDKLLQLIERNKIRNTKTVGSAIKGCLIAKGQAEVYYRFGKTMEWDTAAMQCIVEQAGGVFRQMDGTEMTYNRLDSVNDKGFYALNSVLNKLN